jgi:hypothetical protein
MTLLVAAIDGATVWMVADAAITGVGADVREREFTLKIIPSRDRLGLIGFAGDLHHGRRIAESAAARTNARERTAALLEGQREVPSVAFAHGYMDSSGPHLLRIANGEVRELPTLNLGVAEAFSDFQRIRHDAETDHAPEAVKTFFVGSKAPESIPSGLSVAITSMLRLFAERQERDVGGWVTPYLMTSAGAFLCGYGYGVSDPILTRIGPGSLVPHGTAEAGGFGLSVTELGDNHGVVVYWLQQPGGLIFIRRTASYEVVKFEGKPSEFIQHASDSLGEKVEIFFGDEPHGPPESITVLRDEKGVPSMAIARHGRSFSLSVLNVATPFQSQAVLDLAPVTDPARGQFSSDRLSAAFSEEATTVALGFLTDGKPAIEVSLTAAELSQIIGVLGEKRWMMRDPVPPQHPGAVATGSITRELMAVDPAWRTDLPMHEMLNGITLRLRHPGFGWLTFLLPWQEAKALGDWLTKNSPPMKPPK